MTSGSGALPLLVERTSGLVALCLGFESGRVLLQSDGAQLVSGSRSLPMGALTAAAERLDAEVRRSGLPRAVDDLADLVDLVDRDELGEVGDEHRAADGRHPVRGSYAGAPIWAGGQVVGVVSVLDPAPQAVGRRQIRVLSEFARLLGEQLPGRQGPVDVEPTDELAEVSRALAAGELRPWYQPVIDLTTGSVIGVEALVRWHRPGGSVEGPASFLPAAERTDLVLDLDRAVTRQALADLARWHQHRPDFRVGVNLSGRHLDDVRLLRWLDEAIADAGVPAGTVDLEITETARPSDPEKGRELLVQLAQRGFIVWFDDFGSGWSALQDLIRLPVGGIKLDRTFAEQLGTPIDDAVVAALTTAAGQVGLKVTIEGIEEQEQAERARHLGCHFAQGYLWSRPCPAAEITSMIAS